MKIYHFKNNSAELSFTNHEHRNEIEELKEVISILRDGGCVFIEKGWLPDYDWYLFKYNDAEFYVLYDEFEFSGCVVRTKDDHTMKLIEKIFTDAGIEWCIND